MLFVHSKLIRNFLMEEFFFFLKVEGSTQAGGE